MAREDRPAWAPGGGDTSKPNAGWGGQDPPRLGIEVIVGGMSRRPRVVDGQVAIRDVLDLTLAIDHNVVGEDEPSLEGGCPRSRSIFVKLVVELPSS